MCSALRICDGALLVVDVIEGVMLGTEEIIKYLIKEKTDLLFKTKEEIAKEEKIKEEIEARK